MLNYELTGKVALLRLDDGKANAVGHDLITAVNDGLDRAEAEASALVLLGREGKFSAGFDLSEIQKGPAEAQALVERGAKLMYRLFDFPQPVVAGCTGHAVAAGAFLLLCCDTRIGIDGKFKLGMNETAIGMTLPVFGYELANHRLSRRHLTAAFVQAQLYDPKGAMAVGYLDQLVAPDALGTTAHEIAAQLAELPGEAYAANKRHLRRDALRAIKESLAND